MLVAVATTGYFGYRSGARRFIDLATLAALAQTLSFVASTVIDALSGSLALVAAGVILLTAGVVLERGRRTLLTRLGG
jgi:thiamine transporter ThiT